MSNGTQWQKNKKNFSRPKAGEIGFKSSVGKGKNVWKMCKTCKVKKRREDMGKHGRSYVCYDCQPKLFLW